MLKLIYLRYQTVIAGLFFNTRGKNTDTMMKGQWESRLLTKLTYRISLFLNSVWKVPTILVEINEKYIQPCKHSRFSFRGHGTHNTKRPASNQWVKKGWADDSTWKVWKTSLQRRNKIYPGIVWCNEQKKCRVWVKTRKIGIQELGINFRHYYFLLRKPLLFGELSRLLKPSPYLFNSWEISCLKKMDLPAWNWTRDQRLFVCTLIRCTLDCYISLQTDALPTDRGPCMYGRIFFCGVRPPTVSDISYSYIEGYIYMGSYIWPRQYVID
jgi:hypothetical protein